VNVLVAGRGLVVNDSDAYQLGILEGKRQMFDEMSRRFRQILEESKTAAFYKNFAVTCFSPSYLSKDGEISKIFYELATMEYGDKKGFGDFNVERGHGYVI
jgi:hypothetical protein